jgi:hypothetical protein
MWRRVHPMSLYANGLRAQYHISGKTTFRILCAPAHKMRESRTPGSVRGVLSNGHSYRDRKGRGRCEGVPEWSQLPISQAAVATPMVVAGQVDVFPFQW